MKQLIILFVFLIQLACPSGEPEVYHKIYVYNYRPVTIVFVSKVIASELRINNVISGDSDVSFTIDYGRHNVSELFEYVIIKLLDGTVLYDLRGPALDTALTMIEDSRDRRVWKLDVN